MLAGVEFGAVIESSRHVTIRTGHQDLLAHDVVVVEFDKVAATCRSRRRPRVVAAAAQSAPDRDHLRSSQ